jgi:hypothetical protein
MTIAESQRSIAASNGKRDAECAQHLEAHHDRSAPFEGFHRSTLPDLLKKKPDLQS